MTSTSSSSRLNLIVNEWRGEGTKRKKIFSIAFYSSMFIVYLASREKKKQKKKRHERKRLFFCLCARSDHRPMRKCAAQPTGNGKRIIIIISTLLPWRNVDEQLQKARRRKHFSDIRRSYFSYEGKKNDEGKKEKSTFTKNGFSFFAEFVFVVSVIHLDK